MAIANNTNIGSSIPLSFTIYTNKKNKKTIYSTFSSN